MIDIDLDLPGDRAGTRVVVAMSGGVDSSVVAGLVKRAGYDTVGMTLQLYDHGAPARAGSCCAGADIHDARRVAERLEIPHFVLDYEERFRASVIQPFVESYARGETPVPCVACNRTVKFADLLATARELGAAAMATGHYVRSRSVGNRRALFRPGDADRDQSYFLFGTTEEQLDFLRKGFWRRGWDSNPRYPRGHAAFRVRCFRPLSHLSTRQVVWPAGAAGRSDGAFSSGVAACLERSDAVRQ